jgi:hypothetical protein
MARGILRPNRSIGLRNHIPSLLGGTSTIDDTGACVGDIIVLAECGSFALLMPKPVKTGTGGDRGQF